MSYLYIFLQSNLLEIPIYFLFYRSRWNFRQVAVLTTLANLLTHPPVFFGFMASGLALGTAILVAEAFAVVGETLLHTYFRPATERTHTPAMGWARIALAAFCANLVSWQAAPALTWIAAKLFL